jgi:hypothetical protein
MKRIVLPMSKKAAKVSQSILTEGEEQAIVKTLDKEGFLDQLGAVYASDIFPDTYTASEIERSQKELFDRRFMSGLWSKIPRTCNASCPYSVNKTCKLSKKPYGEKCPEESAFVELLIRKYMESLNIDVSDISSVSMIRDLVDVEIQLIRKQGMLANSDLVILQTVAVDRQGNEIQQLVENPVVATDEKLKKRKGEIMKQLVATRESKIKLATDAAKAGAMDRAARALGELQKAISGPEEEDVIIIDDFIDNE